MTRHALVCGASSGLGEATAIELSRAGHRITLLARRKDRLESVADACRDAGAAATHVLVADFDDRAELVEVVAAHHADHPIDILIHNTGGPPGGPIADAEPDDFIHAMSRHVATAQALAQLLSPHMIDRSWGRIVCITSLSVRQPIVGLGVSNTVRHAMAAWAKTWSKELPPGITVNTVAPGYTDTDRLGELAAGIETGGGPAAAESLQAWGDAAPEGRLGRAEEVGAAAAWLASDAASFVRGVVLPVDGGRLDSI